MNEAITYEEFAERVATIEPAANEDTITRAWEACAWVATLTDGRIRDALIEAHFRGDPRNQEAAR